MATTVAPGSSATISVDAFSTITLTASPACVGRLSYAGGAMDNLRSDASYGLSSKVYGPFGAPGTVTIAVTDGVVTYDVTHITAATSAALAASGVIANRGMGPSAIIHPIGNLIGGASLATLRTWGLRFTTVSRPIAAKLHFGSIEATPATVVKACIAVSTTIGSPAYQVPTGHVWANFTWAGAATTAGPTRVSATVPGIVSSDTVAIGTSNPRSDGPGYMVFLNIVPGAVAETFSYAITNGANSTAADVDTTYSAQLPAGQVFKIRRADGDYGSAATGNSWATNVVTQNSLPLFYLELTLEDGSTTIMGVGDSITAGQGGAGGVASGLDIATALLRSEGRDVFQINSGLPGQTTSTFSTLAMALIPILKPKVAVVSIWSPNDITPATPNVTQASIDNMKRAAINEYKTAMDNGAQRVVFKGSTPLNAITDPAMDALRLSLDAWAASQSWDRLSYLDMGAIYSDGGSPARFKTGLSDDGLHPNSVGYGLEGLALKDHLVSIGV